VALRSMKIGLPARQMADGLAKARHLPFGRNPANFRIKSLNTSLISYVRSHRYYGTTI